MERALETAAVVGIILLARYVWKFLKEDKSRWK
jgi:hypothetical protein